MGLGVVCGKLLRIGRDFTIPTSHGFDSRASTSLLLCGTSTAAGTSRTITVSRRPSSLRRLAAAAVPARNDCDVSLEDGFFDPDSSPIAKCDVPGSSAWMALYLHPGASYHIRFVPVLSRRTPRPDNARIW